MFKPLQNMRKLQGLFLLCLLALGWNDVSAQSITFGSGVTNSTACAGQKITLGSVTSGANLAVGTSVTFRIRNGSNSSILTLGTGTVAVAGIGGTINPNGSLLAGFNAPNDPGSGYVVEAIDINNAVVSASAAFAINSIPTVTVIPASTALCLGQGVTYTLSGSNIANTNPPTTFVPGANSAAVAGNSGVMLYSWNSDQPVAPAFVASGAAPGGPGNSDFGVTPANGNTPVSYTGGAPSSYPALPAALVAAPGTAYIIPVAYNGVCRTVGAVVAISVKTRLATPLAPFLTPVADVCDGTPVNLTINADQGNPIGTVYDVYDNNAVLVASTTPSTAVTGAPPNYKTITVTPTVASGNSTTYSYSVVARDINNNYCSSLSFAGPTLTVWKKPVVTATAADVCMGSAVTVNLTTANVGTGTPTLGAAAAPANGLAVYTWNAGLASAPTSTPAVYVPGAIGDWSGANADAATAYANTATTHTFTPTGYGNAYYAVAAFNGGCRVIGAVTAVKVKPYISTPSSTVATGPYTHINGATTTIVCEGTAVTLEATVQTGDPVGTKYEFIDANNVVVATAGPITASPLAPGALSLQAGVTASQLTITPSVTSGLATTYLYKVRAISPDLNVYCNSSNSVVSSGLTVYKKPTITVTPTATAICDGDAISLNWTSTNVSTGTPVLGGAAPQTGGFAVYTWAPGGLTSAPAVGTAPTFVPGLVALDWSNITGIAGTPIASSVSTATLPKTPAGNAYYAVVAYNGGCATMSPISSVKVKPYITTPSTPYGVITATGTSASDICEGTAISLEGVAHAGDPVGTKYEFMDQTGAVVATAGPITVSPAADGAISVQAGVTAAQLSVTPMVLSGTKTAYTYKARAVNEPNFCTHGYSPMSGAINVYKKPTVTDNTPATVCAGTPLAISYTGVGVGVGTPAAATSPQNGYAVYTWSQRVASSAVPAVGTAPTFVPAAVAGTDWSVVAGLTATNVANTVSTASIATSANTTLTAENVHYAIMAFNGACSATTGVKTVTVKPTPTEPLTAPVSIVALANDGTTDHICSGTTMNMTASLATAANQALAGTVYELLDGTTVISTGTVTGSAAATAVSFANLSLAAGTHVLAVRATYNGCTYMSPSKTIIADPKPTVTATLSSGPTGTEVCQGTSNIVVNIDGTNISNGAAPADGSAAVMGNGVGIYYWLPGTTTTTPTYSGTTFVPTAGWSTAPNIYNNAKNWVALSYPSSTEITTATYGTAYVIPVAYNGSCRVFGTPVSVIVNGKPGTPTAPVGYAKITDAASTAEYCEGSPVILNAKTTNLDPIGTKYEFLNAAGIVVATAGPLTAASDGGAISSQAGVTVSQLTLTPAAGTYTYKVRAVTPKNCNSGNSAASSVITVYAKPTIAVTSTPATICAGQTVTLNWVGTNAATGTPTLGGATTADAKGYAVYTWDAGLATAPKAGTAPTLVPNNAGTDWSATETPAPWADPMTATAYDNATTTATFVPKKYGTAYVIPMAFNGACSIMGTAVAITVKPMLSTPGNVSTSATKICEGTTIVLDGGAREGDPVGTVYEFVDAAGTLVASAGPLTTATGLGGGSISSQAGVTTAQLTITPAVTSGLSTQYNYRVRATIPSNAGYCSSSYSSTPSSAVIVYKKPTGVAITSTTSLLCSGQGTSIPLAWTGTNVGTGTPAFAGTSPQTGGFAVYTWGGLDAEPTLKSGANFVPDVTTADWSTTAKMAAKAYAQDKNSDTYVPTGYGTAYIMVAAFNGACRVMSAPLTVAVKPTISTPAAPLTSARQVCEGSTITIDGGAILGDPVGTKYEFIDAAGTVVATAGPITATVAANGSISSQPGVTSSQLTISPVVTSGLSSQYSYRVRSVNAPNYCTSNASASSDVVTVYVKPTVTPTAPASSCAGKALNISWTGTNLGTGTPAFGGVAPQGGYVVYTWNAGLTTAPALKATPANFVPDGAAADWTNITGISGAPYANTASSHTYTPTAIGTAYYAVAAFNGACRVVSPVTAITINQTPSVPVIITTAPGAPLPASICAGTPVNLAFTVNASDFGAGAIYEILDGTTVISTGTVTGVGAATAVAFQGIGLTVGSHTLKIRTTIGTCTDLTSIGTVVVQTTPTVTVTPKTNIPAGGVCQGSDPIELYVNGTNIANGAAPAAGAITGTGVGLYVWHAGATATAPTVKSSAGFVPNSGSDWSVNPSTYNNASAWFGLPYTSTTSLTTTAYGTAYVVAYAYNGACSATTTLSVKVNGKPGIPAGVAAYAKIGDAVSKDAFCEGASYILNAASTNLDPIGTTYEFYDAAGTKVATAGPLTAAADGGAISSQAGVTAAQLTLTPTPGTYAYKVKAVNGLCASDNSAASSPIIVYAKPTVNVTASTPTTICSGSTVTLNWAGTNVGTGTPTLGAVAPANGFAVYTWAGGVTSTAPVVGTAPSFVPSNGTADWTPGGAAKVIPTAYANTVASVDYTPTGVGTSYVIAMAFNGMCKAVSTPLAITIKATLSAPATPTTSKTAICEGASIVLDAAVRGADPIGSSYEFVNAAGTVVATAGPLTAVATDGALISTLGGVTAAQLTISPVVASGLNTNYSYIVRTVHPNTVAYCNSSNSTASATVTVSKMPTVTATTVVNVCAGATGSQTFTLSGTNVGVGTPVVGGAIAQNGFAVYEWDASALDAPTKNATTSFVPALSDWSRHAQRAQVAANTATSATSGGSFITGTGSAYYVGAAFNGACAAFTPVQKVDVTPVPAAIAGYQVADIVACVGTPVTIIGNLGATPSSTTVAEWLDASGAIITTTTPSGTTATVVEPATSAGTKNYTLRLNDRGCKTTASMFARVTINALPSVTALGANQTVTVITGQSATLTAPMLPLIYSWTGPNGFTASGSTSIVSSTPGSYNLTVTDGNGCSSTINGYRVIASAAAPTVTTSANPSPAVTGGTVALSATGGGSYLWAGPNGFSSTSQTPSINPVTTANAGTYTVTVTGTNGATATGTVSFAVNTPPTATASATPNPASVGGTATLSATGGGTYAWSGPNSFSSTAQSPAISPLTTANAGTYTVTVTGSNGLTATATVVLAVNPAPTTDLALFQDINFRTVMSGDNVYVTIAVVNNGTATATNVKVKNVLPAGITYQTGPISEMGSISHVAGTVTATLASIAPGEMKFMRYNVKVVGTVGQVIINRTEFVPSASYVDSNPSNDWDEVDERIVSIPSSRLSVGQDATQGVSINAYPNPAVENVTIEISDSQPGAAYLEMTDASGRKVIQKSMTEEVTTHKAEVNVSKLATGVYFLRAEMNGNSVTKKVIKAQE
jgi:uncharacterized repeat protein (TIGR01451 family)